jgi:hypothetical protein
LEQQHGSSAACDIPLEDYRYCFDCFGVLNYFFEHVMEQCISDLEKVFQHEKSKPETSSNDAKDEVPDWINLYDEYLLDWYKFFKHIDTIYRTDICKIMRSVVDTNDNDCVPSVMFESLATRTPDLPVRVRDFEEARFFCVLCRRGFESDREIQEHKRYTHKEPTLNSESIVKQEDTPTVLEPPTDCLPKVSMKRKREPTPARVPISVAIWYCSVCKETFYTQGAIKAHNLIKHGGRSTYIASRARSTFTCITCNRRFENQDELDDHTSDGWHMQPPPPIVFDSQIKQNPVALRNAIRLESKPRVVPRNLVKQEYEPAEMLGNATEASSVCTACEMIFTSRRAREDHNRDRHNGSRVIVEPQAMLPASTVNVYSCPVCNIIVKTTSAAARHMKKTNDHIRRTKMIVVEAYACSACRMIFPTKETVARHCVEKHNLSSTILEAATLGTATLDPPLNNNLTCDPCNRVFTTQCGLKQHRKNKHTIDRVFKRRKEYHPSEDQGLGLPLSSPPVYQNASSMNWEITPNEIKQERDNEFTMESHCQLSSKIPDVIEYGSEDRCSEYSEEDPEEDSEEDSEEDPEEDSEDDSEEDPEEDSEEDSVWTSGGDSEDDSGSESDFDMDDTVCDRLDGTMWSEHFRTHIGVPCLFIASGCRETFNRCSKMIKHQEEIDQDYGYVESHCVRTLNGFDWDYILSKDKLGKKAIKLYDGTFKCPNCKKSDDGRFDYLYELVEHAESNVCDLEIWTGPLGKLLATLIEHAVNLSRGRL